MSLLEIRGVKKYFGAKQALKGVSCSIKAGEVFGLLGVNGAGKTTLSSIIVSLRPPTDGDVLFKGTSIYDDITKYRKHIGYCPQKVNLNDKLTLEDNLLQSGRYYGMSESDIKQRFDELVEQFDLGEYLKQKVHVLSGGYAQRFLIARSLMHRPSLVVLDEPTVGLDPHIRHQLWDVIRVLKQDGVSVVLTTHYLDEAEALSDRVCVLDRGEVMVIDTPNNLKKLHNKERLEDVFLHLMNNGKGK